LLLGQVAERMGIRTPNVSRFETGEVRASQKFIARWAAAVGESEKAATTAYWWAILLNCRERTREARRQIGPSGRRK
jgi:transcriptional regulator with XRE-family HTH domain